MIIHKLVEDGCRPGDAGDIIDDRYDGKMPKEGAEAVREGNREKSTSRRSSGNGEGQKGKPRDRRGGKTWWRRRVNLKDSVVNERTCTGGGTLCIRMKSRER